MIGHDIINGIADGSLIKYFKEKCDDRITGFTTIEMTSYYCRIFFSKEKDEEIGVATFTAAKSMSFGSTQETMYSEPMYERF